MFYCNCNWRVPGTIKIKIAYALVEEDNLKLATKIGSSDSISHDLLLEITISKYSKRLYNLLKDSYMQFVQNNWVLRCYDPYFSIAVHMGMNDIIMLYQYLMSAAIVQTPCQFTGLQSLLKKTAIGEDDSTPVSVVLTVCAIW